MSLARAFIHDCLFAAPVVVAGAGLAGGGELAAQTAIAAALFIGHIAWAQQASGQAFRAMANGGTVSSYAMASRVATLPPLAVGMILIAGPLATALAVGCVFGGAVLYAAVEALHRSDAAAALQAHRLVRETSC